MKTWAGSFARHAVASAGTVLILTLLPIISYCAMIIIANDLGGPLNLILIPVCCSVGSILLSGTVFFPISALGEYILVHRLNLKWWLHIPIMAIVFFALGFGLLEITPLLSGRGELNYPLNAMMVGGLPLMICGVLYWVILRFASLMMLKHRANNDLERASQDSN